MTNLMNRRIGNRTTGIILCVFWLLLPDLACADDKKPRRRKEIRTVLDDQVVAWNKGDLPGFMAGYWKSKDLTFYSGKDKRQGWGNAATLQNALPRRRKGDGCVNVSRRLDIKLLSDDYSLVIRAAGRWR